MSVVSSPFYEVHIVAILLVLFLSLATALFLLNCLVSLCSGGGDDDANSVNQFTRENAKYFEIVQRLLKRQLDIERNDSRSFEHEMLLPSPNCAITENHESLKSPLLSIQMTTETISNEKYNSSPCCSPVELMQTNEQHSTDESAIQQNPLLKNDIQLKLTKLRRDLAQFKVDHNIQLRNSKTSDLSHERPVVLLTSESNGMDNSVLLRSTNYAMDLSATQRRTWTEFQNFQIDNLQKFGKKYDSTNKNNNGRSTQALCVAQKTKKRIPPTEHRKKHSKETIV